MKGSRAIEVGVPDFIVLILWVKDPWHQIDFVHDGGLVVSIVSIDMGSIQRKIFYFV